MPLCPESLDLYAAMGRDFVRHYDDRAILTQEKALFWEHWRLHVPFCDLCACATPADHFEAGLQAGKRAREQADAGEL